MKTIKLLLIVCIGIMMQSCNKPGKIRVQNNISRVKIVDVEWGDIYITKELLPGETSKKITIHSQQEKLPSSHKIAFKMTANNQTIYLQTEEVYLLNKDDDIIIVLTDETKVKNPNE